MPQSYDATVGEIGRTIALQTGGYVISGATATIIITNTSTLATVSYTGVIAGDGLSVSYVTVGTEFPSPGTYKIQLKVVMTGPNRTLYNQPPISYEVGPALA